VKKYTNIFTVTNAVVALRLDRRTSQRVINEEPGTRAVEPTAELNNKKNFYN